MTDHTIFLGEIPLHTPTDAVAGDLVERHGQLFYRISNYDRMPPFFLSIVSDSDHWMFLSSTGALTAGRKNAEHALFPYTTDDKIHDSANITGSRTLLLVELAGRRSLWEPFSPSARDAYDLQRNLYKSVWGNLILFEEINRDLALTFQYAWHNSDQFGFVKRARISNQSATPCALECLDGLQNLLPHGVDRTLQSTSSTLLDAYKRNELDPATGLGLFRLSSIPVDRPEPSEALRVTTVWSEGLTNARYLLSTRQLASFRRGQTPAQEIDVRAERGAYFVQGTLTLPPDGDHDWSLVAEADQGPGEVAELLRALRDKPALRQALDDDIRLGTDRLQAIVARADGLQQTADRLTATRHYSNVMFNVMRGGVFPDEYVLEMGDFASFLEHHNRPVAGRHRDWLRELPDRCLLHELLEQAAARRDPQLLRLCYEYLPLTFSRRHGDPSRPWNTFSIDIRKPDGRRNLFYQGNWRDIFQNWEALGRSFPEYLEGMIFRFVNSSTADGYNPYRITRDGIDWEVVEPANPWSFIGYWGDHQIIYLLKLLELSRAHHPGMLTQLLTRDLFAYANVPYRIRPYEALLADPHRTIDYDLEEQARVNARVADVGADGKLVCDQTNQPYLANLAEKLLVPALAKFSNFVPEAGIWMNTQRPEWNDANNALVGYGTSMVTLYYLRRYQLFFRSLLLQLDVEQVAISAEVAELFRSISSTFAQFSDRLDSALPDPERRRILDALGEAGSRYRSRIYSEGFAQGKVAVSRADLVSYCDQSLKFIDHSMAANQRPDRLFHAYNLISVNSDAGVKIRPLYEMLEGQVAALSSGYLTPEQSLDVLRSLRASALYRADQRSYLLYPDRDLPRFLELNRIPAEAVASSRLMQRLLDDQDPRLVLRDVQGAYHFCGDLRNANGVAAALDALSQDGYQDEVAAERQAILDLWEELFDHRSYTGRSGTFFGYEGLGCIYWHMVSKLLLAVQETFFRARSSVRRFPDCVPVG